MGLGYYDDDGSKYQVIGIVLDKIRADGRPKSKWEMTVVLLKDNVDVMVASPYIALHCSYIDDTVNAEVAESHLLSFVCKSYMPYMERVGIDPHLLEGIETVRKQLGLDWNNPPSRRSRKGRGLPAKSTSGMIYFILIFLEDSIDEVVLVSPNKSTPSLYT